MLETHCHCYQLIKTVRFYEKLACTSSVELLHSTNIESLINFFFTLTPLRTYLASFTCPVASLSASNDSIVNLGHISSINASQRWFMPSFCHVIPIPSIQLHFAPSSDLKHSDNATSASYSPRAILIFSITINHECTANCVL